MKQDRTEKSVFSNTDTGEYNLLSLENRGNMPQNEAITQPNALIDLPSDKRCYTVEDLQMILSCGRETIYSLLNRHEFRWFRLGGKRGAYRISKRSFDEWLDQMSR